MSRTVRIKKSKELKEKDFYQTHPAMVRALVDNYNLEGFILDPCAGHLSIGNGLREKGLQDIIEHDINPCDFSVAKIDFLQQEVPENNVFNAIIMNPPYSNKYAFIDKALEYGCEVFVLLPLDTSNYNIFHKRYLDVPQYQGRLLMTPKVILHEGLETKRGGNSSYAWYHYDPNVDAIDKYEKYADLMEYGLAIS